MNHNSCKIVDYTSEYRESLKLYLKNTFPDYSEAYLDYCLDLSDEACPSMVVLNEKDEIVGCHLYFPTRMILNGKICETEWGHDTFLNQEYRAKMGLDLVFKINSKKGLGIGLSETQKEISKKFKHVFFDGVFNYYFVNRKCIHSLIQLLFRIKPTLVLPNIIEVDGLRFSRISNVKDMSIPDNGYWYRDNLNIDFVRDENFINTRFLRNKVNEYALYALSGGKKMMYFVVRPIICHNIPAITLSDFRYDIEHPKSIEIIFKAINKIAALSNLGLISFVAGDKNVNYYFKKKLHYKKRLDFISMMKIPKDSSFSVTGADSDSDFLKQKL